MPKKKKELAQNNTGILYEAIRPQVRGLLAGAVSSVWLLGATHAHTHKIQHDTVSMQAWSGLLSGIHTNTGNSLVHANALA